MNGAAPTPNVVLVGDYRCTECGITLDAGQRCEMHPVADVVKQGAPFLLIVPGRYFSTVWFAGDKAHTQDIMAALWRDSRVDDNWHLAYRFRYYAEAPGQPLDAFSGKDEKSCYELTAPVSHPQAEIVAIQGMDRILDKLAQEGAYDPAHKLFIRSDEPRVMLSALRREKFAHLKWAEGDAQAERNRQKAARRARRR